MLGGPAAAGGRPRMSLPKLMHSAQMQTPGPATSRKASAGCLPQKEQDTLAVLLRARRRRRAGLV